MFSLENTIDPHKILSYESVTEVTNDILLRNSGIVSGIFIGIKALAVVFVLLTWIKEYVQGMGAEGQKLPISVYSIVKGVLYIALICSFDYVTDLLDKGLGAYEASFNLDTTDQMYSIGEQWMEEFENETIEDEEQKGFFGKAWDAVKGGLSLMRDISDVWFWLLQIVKFIAWCVNMMVYPIFLLERGFLLVVMKMALPLVLALGVLPAYKQMVTKWIALYCAIFLTGLFFILATQFCDAAYALIIKNNSVGWVAGVISPNFTKTIVFLVIAFAKVKLYKGAVDLSYKIFNA